MIKNASKEMKLYFENIEKDIQKSYDIAEEARKKNYDVEDYVAIPVAKNMAERVVGLISVLAPQIIKSDIPKRIIELEKEYGMLDWRVAFKISVEVAKQKFCKFADKKEAMEIGIRVGFSYLTLGIVSAPLEGFIGLKIKKRKDGKEYFALQYASPIRAAGGTASSVSVLLADYVRVKMGYSAYDPDESEVNRYNTEIHDYHDRITNLQYHPSDEELKFLVSHLPVEVDGDPTEKMEVSNYKDLPRIETNLIRGGVALVLAEGLSQKIPKLWKRLAKWGQEFGLGHWDFLSEFLQLKEKIHAEHSVQDKGNNKEEKTVKANNTFIMDLVAGRPILTHPLGVGGFRLRYGRNRTSGFSASSLHPATLIVLNKFIAIGTQMKVERPGKATTVTLCDTLEGPIVTLKDGTVLQLNTETEAKTHFNQIEEILFLGDILFNYGDFSENGHSLVPAGYCSEWWALEVVKSINNIFNEKKENNNSNNSNNDNSDNENINKDNKNNNETDEIDYSNLEQSNNLVQPHKLKKISEIIDIDEKKLFKIINYPLTNFPNLVETLNLSNKLNVPLHPEFLFYWKLITGEELLKLQKWFNLGKIKTDEIGIKKIILPFYSDNELQQESKRILEKLGTSHWVINKESVVLDRKESNIFAFIFNFKNQKELENLDLCFNLNLNSNQNLNYNTIIQKNALELINILKDIEFKDKAGTFIGARMGRPEKAKMRSMTGSPQVMFPVGEEGDRLRSFQATFKAGKINCVFPTYYCDDCKINSIYAHCVECKNKTKLKFHCRFCGDLDKETCRHGDANNYKTMDLDIKYYFQKAKEHLGEKLHPDLIKGVRGTSNKTHVVENLSKGILRAKHGIYVNKDGTTRYDCTELPLTHFKPKEIHTSIEKLKQLGYKKDIYENDLVNNNQLLEIKAQDIIIPGFDSLEESAPKVLTKVANFIDELLVKFYGLKPFYKLKSPDDLVGHLVVGLAPHISAGLVGRIIGYSESQGLITHPMYHAGMRRDCDGDEAGIMLLMDALLNFSRKYLPERRGAKTMDAPLVLTALLNPSEIDDQVHGIDVMWKYPLEFYEATLEMKNPWEVKYGIHGKKITQLNERLDTPLQYQSFGFTHHIDNINKGVHCSAYKTLPSMAEKLIGQMDIAKKVRAVNMDDVAKLVIQKHFLKDIKGNLRKFSMQQFRCVGCNSKFRRPPLNGKCSECNGKIIFTISEGSVIKYLGPSLMLAEKYDFSPYLKQTLNILKMNVDHIFGKEKDKQVGLGNFIA